MDLLACVRRTIRRHQLAGPGTRVIVALSGGSDSVALTHLLAMLSRSGELSLVGAVHFNHMLRDEADADERLSAELAAELSLRFISGRGDVAALARMEGRSLEDAARTARHAFLEKSRIELGGDVVAFGHTRDDQAETLLLRLLRGAGAAGLGGMHPRRGVIIRPVLDCRRNQLRDYATAHGLRFTTDQSNNDVAIPRNRVRAELVPLLEQRFNPSIVDVLACEAALLRDEQSFIAEQSSEWLAVSAEQTPTEARLPVAALLEAPAAVARMALAEAMRRLARGRPIAFFHAEDALDLAKGRGEAFDAPGQRVQRIGDEVVLTSRGSRTFGTLEPPRANLFEYLLSIPGETQIAETGAAISAQMATIGQLGRDGDANVGYVHVPSDSWPLKVRTRRPGDRFQPFGMSGRKKLQDFFVDQKVGRDERDRIPIVVDAADRIVWVAGHRIEHSFRVKDPSQPVIILRLKAVGGPV